MWSLGVLLYEMMTYTYPFTGRGTADLAQRVCLGRYSIPSGGYSSDLVSVVRRLLQVNPVLRPTVHEILQMQCIQSRLHVLDQFIGKNTNSLDKLLSTIKIPDNIRHVSLPSAAYGKKAEIVKPLEERLHVRKGIPVRKEWPMISSPEMQQILDSDWWSPNKEGENYTDVPMIPGISDFPKCISQRSIRNRKQNPVVAPAEPLSRIRNAPKRNVPAMIQMEAKRIPNPRFRRPAIR
jgi:serine/threonine protein kinase